MLSQAVVVATGVTEDGDRGPRLDVGDSEDGTISRAFPVLAEGPRPGWVGLVISDQHAGLLKALTR